MRRGTAFKRWRLRLQFTSASAHSSDLHSLLSHTVTPRYQGTMYPACTIHVHVHVHDVPCLHPVLFVYR